MLIRVKRNLAYYLFHKDKYSNIYLYYKIFVELSINIFNLSTVVLLFVNFTKYFGFLFSSLSYKTPPILTFFFKMEYRWVNFRDVDRKFVHDIKHLLLYYGKIIIIAAIISDTFRIFKR